MLVDMSDPADTVPPNCSDSGAADSGDALPTGTVTLLSAGIEGSARLWESKPEEMAAAMARLGGTVADMVGVHGGVRPLKAGAGDGFVVAFARASDALACAVDLQRAPSAPIRLQIGMHTGEVAPRGDARGIGAVAERAARLHELAHGGQTLLSAVTEELVADRVPAGVWLTDLGNYPVLSPAHPERVVQLCHPDLRNDFPPLRTGVAVTGQCIPAQLTSFVGRQAELNDVRQLVSGNRLVTLTGAGGVGKTRLAVQLAGQLADPVWWVDLAPITGPDLVATAVAHTLGLPDQPGRSALDTVARFIADQQMLVVLDNCEHLLDACAELTVGLLGACDGLTILTTSREPIGVAGEVTWRTPSLSLKDEAVELFGHRARLARPDFSLTEDNAAVVTEICRRLDGIPLAIELAAARVRALSVGEILDSLHDRFRLLTGGARTAVRRQQALRASVDWSYALLSQSERVLLRRLAVFLGGFDLAAAHAVAGAADVPRHRVLDEVSLLVDKSLVVVDDSGHHTRYRLLETVRQYALEKLVESGEADAVRTRHRDHYTAVASAAGGATSADHQRRIERAENELDNFRAAFAWSRDNSDIELGLQLASSLQPLWLRGRILEGLTWFDAVLAAEDTTVAPAARACALADKTILDAIAGVFGRLDQVGPALAIARDLDDSALLARVLTACGATAAFSAEIAVPHFTEAIERARTLGDDWQLSQALGWRALSAFMAGDPNTARVVAEEGRDLADTIGDPFISRMCRWHTGLARWMSADLAGAAAQFGDVTIEAHTARDLLWNAYSLFALGQTLSYRGDTDGARAAAEAAIAIGSDITGFQQALGLGALADAALAAGDAAAAATASKAAWETCPQVNLLAVNAYPMAQSALAAGDLSAARQWADQAVCAASGGHRMIWLSTRVRVAIAQGDVETAESDAHDALVIAEENKAFLTIPDVIECLAGLSADSASHQEAARLFGAAAAIRDRTGQTRFKIYDADYQAAVAVLRGTLGDSEFAAAWAEGTALSTDEAISYVRRGRGKRKRPARGWAALTPTERDVVRLVNEGLTNKDVAARLFVSVRTVQTHLTHIYAKLGLTSRTQLVQQAAAPG